MARWTSRKFLTALIVELAALAALLWPQHEQQILQAAQGAAALVVMGLTALGYISAEASIDRARQSLNSPPSGAATSDPPAPGT